MTNSMPGTAHLEDADAVARPVLDGRPVLAQRLQLHVQGRQVLPEELPLLGGMRGLPQTGSWPPQLWHGLGGARHSPGIGGAAADVSRPGWLRLLPLRPVRLPLFPARRRSKIKPPRPSSINLKYALVHVLNILMGQCLHPPPTMTYQSSWWHQGRQQQLQVLLQIFISRFCTPFACLG